MNEITYILTFNRQINHLTGCLVISINDGNKNKFYYQFQVVFHHVPLH